MLGWSHVDAVFVTGDEIERELTSKGGADCAP
jgi:hypothetical protein